MNNTVTLDKSQALQKLKEHSDIVDNSNIRQTVQNSLDKLDEVEKRIDKLEKKNFFQRALGSITGHNEREMVAAMRDFTKAQQLTIQLVLSLAVLNGENQQALEDILDELNGAKRTHTRIADHIDFLYAQVQIIKVSSKKKEAYQWNPNQSVRTPRNISEPLILFLGIGTVIILIFIIIKLY